MKRAYHEIVRLVVLTACVACGRVGFDARAAPDAAPQLLETLTVPGIGTLVPSTTVLVLGVTYQLRASGVFVIQPYCDAEYAFSGPDGVTSDGYLVDLCDDNMTDAGLSIDDPQSGYLKTPHWGPYRADHIYVLDFVGKGAPIVAQIHDVAPANNSGALTLDIIGPP